VSNILVTGATGFLGRHLVQALKRLPGNRHMTLTSRSVDPGDWESAFGPDGGYTYGGFRCDLTKADHVRKLMSSAKPNVVYHLAANPIIKPDPDDPFAISQDNILATHHLLEYCPEGTRFVFMSSAAVYGDPPFADDEFGEHCPLRPTSVYGATKAAGEALVRAYTKLGRVNGVIMRGVANVGAWATHGLVHDLVRKAKSKNPRLELLGEAPGSVKPFIYAGDTAKALVQFGTSHLPFRGAVNVCTDDQITVSDVARIVLDTLGIDKPVYWSGSSWKGDNPTVRVRNDMLKFMDWQPSYPTSAEAVRYAVKEMEALGC
jgi:UDP-glucose 4-epimerase